MNKRMGVRKCALLLSLVTLASVVPATSFLKPQTLFAAQSSNSTSTQDKFQIDQKFPIDEKDDNPDFDTWSLLNNVTRKFYGFAGQGYLYVYSNNASKFGLYVNGKKVALKAVKPNSWTKINIARVTKNGNNSLQIARKGTSASDTLQIKVPYPTLVNQAKEKKNLQNNSFKLMDTLIKQEIKHGFSSAQIAIVHNGKIIKQSSYGLLDSYSESGERLTTGPKVNNSTLYDLASNTKMYATNFAIQKLVSEGKLDINAKVSSIFPDFQDKADDKIKGKSNLTIRDILMHQAGFPADPQYHNNNYDPTNPSVNKANANPVYTQDRSQALNKIIATPLNYVPGTKTIYSDVDYMLLGLIVEKITGQREDDYVEHNIYQPLGLTHTLYNPLQKGFTKNQITAAELNGNTRDHTISFNNVRTHTLQGEVHDEKAFYTMKGVSGHAGLFSNASDLAVLAQTVINRGGYGKHRIFDEDTLDEFIKPKSTDPSYGLGWRRQASGKYAWAFSNFADESTVGHTGWTGTLTVVDPKENTAVILLTNCRNTPIINAKQTPNDFAGSHYRLAKYGDIVGLAFAGINHDSKNANNQKLISLVTQRYNEIVKNKGDQTFADKNDLAALYGSLKSRRKHGNNVDKFMKSHLGVTIKKFIE
ncbi:penicillin binding protein PBP4B [Lactobacillus sp. ESL0785]|uniref:penicillin binding protein PBP4B n=1 Tax=Lactobacillus sp. ESL0785 TaxID=2983232 RepID=UPI0023F93A9A|nr:penicillin binding protein PBP4B [Lactobacillus sp. ESL0785]WEV70634.1 penicillin binding protein PBP4B [Lactobacillus sp. ESL0785]